MSTAIKAAHSEIGASSMERWSKCPGSVRLSKGIPNISSVYAEEGTRAHDLAADWLQKGVLPPDDTEEETFLAIETYVTHVQDLWKSLVRHDKTKMFIEHKFDLTSIYPGLFGTADAVIYCGHTQTLYVFDFKFGKGIPVDPENNPQLMYYGIGALISMNVPVARVVLKIIQPRYSSDLKEAIKAAEVDPIDMLDFAVDLKEYAEATTKSDAAVVLGDHCQFCRAKPVCPALRAEAEIAVKEAFADDVSEKIQTLTAEDVGILLVKIDAVEFWCTGVREHAYAMAQSGVKIPGFKLVPKQARRKWNDETAARRAIESAFVDNMVRECLTEPKLKSPAQVEKVLGKDAKEFVASLNSAVSSGETLVPDSDKRQDVSKTKAASLFADDLM